MVSKVNVGSAAYVQQLSPKNDNQSTKAVNQQKEVDKVKSIKQQLSNGEYKFDSQKTAEAVTRDLI